jgi:hypothetical protein
VVKSKAEEALAKQKAEDQRKYEAQMGIESTPPVETETEQENENEEITDPYISAFVLELMLIY